MAEGDYVMLHGRFWGEHRPVNWIGVDILRIADGVLAEHWDVLQDEATAQIPRAVCRCSATASSSRTAYLRRKESIDGEQRQGIDAHRVRPAVWDPRLIEALKVVVADIPI